MAVRHLRALARTSGPLGQSAFLLPPKFLYGLGWPPRLLRVLLFLPNSCMARGGLCPHRSLLLLRYFRSAHVDRAVAPPGLARTVLGLAVGVGPSARARQSAPRSRAPLRRRCCVGCVMALLRFAAA